MSLQSNLFRAEFNAPCYSDMFVLVVCPMQKYLPRLGTPESPPYWQGDIRMARMGDFTGDWAGF